MSVLRGQRDIRAKDQSAGIPERHVSNSQPFRSVAHYNRLEPAPLNRVSPPARQLLHQPAQTAARPNGRCDPAIPAAGATPWNNLFLVHRGESCNKQVSGVSPFRKGIVL
jgi:hypothetical protein